MSETSTKQHTEKPMSMKRKKCIQIVVAILLLYISLCVLGIIRVLPARANKYYSTNYHPEDGVITESLGRPVRCPVCHSRLNAMYYGVGDWHPQDYDYQGHAVWKWGGCIYDGTWKCQKCGMRYDSGGHMII